MLLTFHVGRGHFSSLKKAFSLIEMLVVVSIISVLLAFLLPSIGSARRVAQAQVCANNQRQIGMGFVYYAQDFVDRIPPTGTSSQYHFDTTRGVENQGRAFYHYIGKQGYWGVSEVRTDTAISVTNTRWQVLKCPSETGGKIDAVMQGRTYFDWGRTYSSFVINWSVTRGDYYIGYGSVVNPFRIGWARGSPYFKPAEASVVYDCHELGNGWALPYAEWNQDSALAGQVSLNWDVPGKYNYMFRHNNLTRNALFMDGHVGAQRHFSFTGVALYKELWKESPPSPR